MDTMKHLFFYFLPFLAGTAGAQTKTAYVAYNKLTLLQGTEYVMASAENRTKMATENKYLLFINTNTGENRQIDFPKDAYIQQVEQVWIDSLGINKVLIVANTVNLDGNKAIDWNDPKQLIVCSPDGSGKVQLTEDKFFAGAWIINRQNGVIVITGHYDSNGNGKYDHADQNEILLFDLKKMALIKKI
jgi:hypothetical protein